MTINTLKIEKTQEWQIKTRFAEFDSDYYSLPSGAMHHRLLVASTSVVEWYKFHAHTSFLSQVIQILIPTQREQSII